MNNRKLVLENGLVFEGIGFGSDKEVIAEVIFNTNVVGYQEIISDPTNCKKIVCMSYPLIGNYGLADDDYESKHIYTSGMVVREYNDIPSNFRYTRTLSEVMEENEVSGISGIDTRELVRVIRDEGSMKAMICDIAKDTNDALGEIKAYSSSENLVSMVSSKKVWYSRTINRVYNVVIIDCGLKLNLVKRLNEVGCNVVVVPYNTSAEEILKYKPNGLFISNGPGSPYKQIELIEVINKLKGKLPILGVCLGHQLLAISYGASVNKMKFGKHGSNYPIKNLQTGKIEITSKNTSYVVDKASLIEAGLTITHEEIISGDVEGFVDSNKKVISIDFEPNVPIDENSENVFFTFVEMMKKYGGKRRA